MPGRNARRTQRPIWAALTVLLLFGMITSLFLAGRAKQSAEASATSRAQLAVQQDLAPLLTPSDLAQPVTGERYQTLSALVTRRLLSAGPSDGVTLYDPEATIVFDVERGMVGRHESALRARIQRVIDQGRESTVEGNTFHSYVPLRLRPEENPIAVADVTQPYAPLWSSASKPWRLAAIGFAALLLPALGLLLLSLRGSLNRISMRSSWGRGPEGVNPAASSMPARVAASRADSGIPPSSPVYEHPGYRAEVEARRQAEERAARAEEAAESVRRELKRLKEQAGAGDLEGVSRLEQQFAEAQERAHAAEAERVQLSEKLRRTETQRAELFDRLDRALEQIADAKQEAANAPVADPEIELRAQAAQEQAAEAERRASKAEDAVRASDFRAIEAESARKSAEQQVASMRAALEEAERGPGSGALEDLEQLEEKVARAESRAAAAEVRTMEAESRAVDAEEQLATAEARTADAAIAASDDARLTAAEEEIASALSKLATSEEKIAAAQERATKAEDMAHLLGERVRAAEERAHDADGRARGAGEIERTAQERIAEVERAAEERIAEALARTEAAEERIAEAERQSALAKRALEATESEALRATDRAVEAERAAGNVNDRLADAREQARAATEQLAAVQEQARISTEQLAEGNEELRRANERADANRGEAITAEEREAAAEEGANDARGQLALAQEQARTAREELAGLEQRAERAEEHLRRLAEERATGTEAAERQADQQPQLEEVLRVTKERLHRSGERLQATEERARGAEHDMETMKERVEELEGVLRREKLHDALQHLRGEEQTTAHTAPIEERRAAAPFMKALSLDARNSVAAIQGLVLAMKHSEKAEEQPNMLRKLNAHARKLDRLVGDLLDADRLARGEFELKVRRTDIEALVKRVVDESAIDGERAVRVETERIVVAVDPIRVEGIIVALLNNSIDRSRPRHDITLRVVAQDGGALISVEDEEPSSDASMSPVVARFADIHGGWAIVESRQGGGSAFRVFLPDHGAEGTHTTIAPERDTIEIRDSAERDLSADAPQA